ncbi:hypothetical protein J1605_015386 [Eschrichtius robustus]|uniref:Uncharacterized protein n=1 Tax=Eschrichtius robustus TaxID=9764 RepID=A0AB34G9W1_ESCRO|nr:hypothetical protein J1605_015386 [Eschrichtius robustus]
MGLVPSDLTGLGQRNSGFYEHRRSSVVLNLSGLEVFPGDLLVSDGAADYLCHPLLLLNSASHWYLLTMVVPCGGSGPSDGRLLLEQIRERRP